MEAYDPATVFSSIDHGGRYAYGNQPVVAGWNLARLAEALLPLLDDDEDRAVALATEALDGFLPALRGGLGRRRAGQARPARRTSTTRASATWPRTSSCCCTPAGSTTPRRSARSARPPAATTDPARALLPDRRARGCGWRGGAPPARTPTSWTGSNPVYVPRNHLVEEALDAATGGDLAPFERLLEVVSDPYVERPGLERYAAPAPDGVGPYRTFCGT